MTLLLGDIGGTNARLALARGGAIDAGSITRFRGDDYARFEDVIDSYLAAQGRPALSGLCIAVAGPVSRGRASLTNRDWSISAAGLEAQTGAGRVRLINDLAALGHATPSLQGTGLDVLRKGPEGRDRNGQALVLGLGTGVNICAVRVLPDGSITTLEAEEGHVFLPANIWRRLVDLLGAPAAEAFFSVEETFAGRGLSRFHALRSKTAPQRGEAIMQAAGQGDPEALASAGAFAELVGLLLRELALQYMPLEGVFMAGSVGRALAQYAGQLEIGFLHEAYMRHIPENIPLYVIRDDMAALNGCLAALSQP